MLLAEVHEVFDSRFYRRYDVSRVLLAVHILAVRDDICKVSCFRHKGQVHGRLRRGQVLVEMVSLGKLAIPDMPLSQIVQYAVEEEGLTIHLAIPEQIYLLLRAIQFLRHLRDNGVPFVVFGDCFPLKHTIQAVLNMTYDGPMPEQKPDGSYTSIYATYLRYNIAGINYRKRIKDYVGKTMGYIQPEPTNQYDPNAIAVYAEDGHHLGYIPEAETFEVYDLKLPFPIKAYCEIEECYDYDRQRNFFVGHILIEQPDCARTCAPAGSNKE